MTMATELKILSENPESTVVAEFKAVYRPHPYQSEAELEAALIKQLKGQAYQYLDIKAPRDLELNLRRQLERLNHVEFTDDQWHELFTGVIANAKDGIVEKTELIQERATQVLKNHDGSFRNIVLIDKENIHNNSLQVINQYTPHEGLHRNRYDVTILVNGLPLVHIELKRRGVELKEAFNQISRYQRESFWADSGLFEYVQIFVISNGTQTKYYSNTTRLSHIDEVKKNGSRGAGQRTSHSYEFTSWWTDAQNARISDLTDFASTFLSKHTLLRMLTRYCVLTVNRLLLVMRPYQIAATEALLQRINVAYNNKQQGTVRAGGYIWHTTGSGKTLTSFKTAQLATKLSYIDKVLFVVDRKDLDYQTMQEYDRFCKGCANGNTSTAILTRQLGSNDSKIIITTIQKLTNFVSRNPRHKVYGENVVLIFDECHRSQSDKMHGAIERYFKKYFLFGFTGTPIFAVNASKSNLRYSTTEKAFGDRLHTYTIIHAIRDGNVLPFKVDYISTMKTKDGIADKDVFAIDRLSALESEQRRANIVRYIIEHFDAKTHRNKSYLVSEKKRLYGFNSIFAISSIPELMKYYDEFQRQLGEMQPDKRLKVATIFSYCANEDPEDESGLPDDENSESTEGLDASSREFLERAIGNYNSMFGTKYDTSSERFQNYYKDLSQRVKNRQVDILLVVNMFLTGFDATTLNTLWVDKNLRMHGLLQAFSRTNRILNSVKTCGNIVCFRNLEESTNQSLALFGDKDVHSVVLLRPFVDYYMGYKDKDGREYIGYKPLVEKILAMFPLGVTITGEESEKQFIRLFGALLKLINILSTFDEFGGKEILTEGELQDYRSVYLELYRKWRREKTESENVEDDVVFEMELLRQQDINIDYILFLVKKYHDQNMTNAEIVVQVAKAIDSSPELHNKKDLIENFISQMTPKGDTQAEWREYVDKERLAEINRIIAEENLKPEPTYKLLEDSFASGALRTEGTAIANLLPPMSMFSKDNAREKKRQRVTDTLKTFFAKFWDISGGHFK